MAHAPSAPPKRAAVVNDHRDKLDGAEFLKMLETKQITRYINQRFGTTSRPDLSHHPRQTSQHTVDSFSSEELVVDYNHNPHTSRDIPSAGSWFSPDESSTQAFANAFSYLVINNDNQTSKTQASHIYSLVETLPWPPRIIIECLQRTLGPRSFRLYHKPTRLDEATGEYFVEILELPLDFDPALCIVGPEFRAGHLGGGFYATLTPVLGFCKHCRIYHEGKICQSAELIDTHNIDCANLDRDLLPYYQTPHFPLVSSLLDLQ